MSEASGNLISGWLGCEAGKTLGGALCWRKGEAEFEGRLLCKQHDRQFRAQDRVDLLQGVLSHIHLLLPHAGGAGSGEFMRHRAEVVAANLSLAYRELELAGRDGPQSDGYDGGDDMEPG